MPGLCGAVSGAGGGVFAARITWAVTAVHILTYEDCDPLLGAFGHSPLRGTAPFQSCRRRLTPMRGDAAVFGYSVGCSWSPFARCEHSGDLSHSARHSCRPFKVDDGGVLSGALTPSRLGSTRFPALTLVHSDDCSAGATGRRCMISPASTACWMSSWSSILLRSIDCRLTLRAWRRSAAQ